MLEAPLFESLSRFSLLLNSHHDQKTVISLALEHISDLVHCEAATLFLLNEEKTELLFWAVEGGAGDTLAGNIMPLHGIVGWVVKNKRSTMVNDVKNDPRFFKDIDSETSFVTKNLMCVPLIVRGSEVIGALEVVNATDSAGFTNEELSRLEVLGNLTALAVDNANLVTSLREQTQTLEELNKKKEDVLSIIAHEFRTPLNVIQMSAELLAQKMVRNPADEERVYGSLLRAVGTLTQRVVDIRDVTLISDNPLRLEKENQSMTRLVKDVATAFAPGAQGRSIHLTFQEPVEPFFTRFDPSLFFLAVSNIVRNAIRFTPDKGSIVLEIKRNAGFLHVSVTDTGIGIPKEKQDAIFQKFFENVSIMKHSSGDLSFQSAGLGLGLSTARAIAKAHRGDLTVQSVEGKGSTFTFTIPVS